MPRSVEVQLYDDDMNGMLGNLWEKFNTVKRDGPQISPSAYEMNAEEFKAINDSISQADKDNIVESLHSTFYHDKDLDADYSDKTKTILYDYSAKAINDLVDSMIVNKPGKAPCSYKSAYGIPTVTEENKYAVMGHIVANMATGELAQGYLDGKISITRHGRGTTTYGKKEVEDLTPAKNLQAHHQATEAEPPKKPSISWFTKALGTVQKWVGYDGDASKALDKYNMDYQMWKHYDDTIRKTNDLIDAANIAKEAAFDARKKENTDRVGNLYEEKMAEKAEEKAKQDRIDAEVKKEADRLKEADKAWEDKFATVKSGNGFLREFKTDDKFVERQRNFIKDLNNNVKNCSDVEGKKERLKSAEKAFDESLKIQNKLRDNKIKATNSKDLAKDLGLNKETNAVKRTGGNAKAKQNDLEKQPMKTGF